MKTLSHYADLSAFCTRELELLKLGQPLNESLHNFQMWLCNYLTLIHEETDRTAFLNTVNEQLNDLNLLFKYQTIYTKGHHSSDSKLLIDSLLSYLNVKYGELLAA